MRSFKYPFFKTCLLVLAVFACQLAVKAQTPQGIQQIIAKVDTFNNKLPAEKLYLQFDKPYYAAGDTMWFKAYLVNPSLAYSPLSSRLYVELLNDSSKVIRRQAIQLLYGTSWGNISLEGIREGAYSIRAYTNWMRNFNQDYFYNRTFYIANPQRQTWTVSANSELSGTGDAANTVNMNLKFTSLDAEPSGLRNLQLRVMDGKKSIYKGAVQTSPEGLMKVNFTLPEKTAVKNLSLVAQDKASTNRRIAVIPVNANRARDVDVQFMPESGYLVAGLPAHVGFKAIGEDGRGIDVSGKIINTTTGQEVLTFKSIHKGIGVFDLAPQTGDVYTARITLPGGQVKEAPLPVVKASGSMLRVRNLADRDSMDVYVFLTPDMAKPGGTYYLVGQARGVVCFGAAVPSAKPYSAIHIAKSMFPAGIAHITLLNAANQPLNERLTYIAHNDNLKITITPGVNNAAPHDSIPLKISVADASGKPVTGSFSVAVTDDAQIKADSTGADNIISRFLLSSDLKGYVEDPAYYFNDTKSAWQALDGLLLTQGWVGYNWSQLNNPPKPTFAPEVEYTVTGKVTNLTGKGIANAEVSLLSTGKYRIIKDTTTNAEGRFLFNKFPPIDSVTFVLQAVNKRHKVINAGISIDENQTPPVNNQWLPHALPWYVNPDAPLLNFVKTNPVYHTELDKAQYGPAGRLLKTVTIRNNAIVKGSENLNGSGEADQVIDEQAIEDANKISLGELLEQKVKDFRVGYLPVRSSRGLNMGGNPMRSARSQPTASNDMYYFIKDKRVHFVFDGVDINRFFQRMDDDNPIPNEYYNYVKGYLDYFTAEDIKGIEVLYSQRYTSNYNNLNLSTEDLLAESPAGARGSANAYIEITTRAGNGPYSARATGVYVYKPMLLSIPKDFYRPRYAMKSAAKYGDLRSTIHWQPSVITKAGQATVSFYAADKPATYTVVLEGTDLSGKVGYQTQKITVGKGGQ